MAGSKRAAGVGRNGRATNLWEKPGQTVGGLVQLTSDWYAEGASESFVGGRRAKALKSSEGAAGSRHTRIGGGASLMCKQRRRGG
jgi:hypothetical protein